MRDALVALAALAVFTLFIPAWRGSRSKAKHEGRQRAYRGGLK